ncbi:MAG: SAM-dependent methyltransferase [Bacillus subtilis]|nr:SAM-dependent methyltransferase [Bacillus subtilis]
MGSYFKSCSKQMAVMTFEPYEFLVLCMKWGLQKMINITKKKSGQYYTPADVSKLMATWLLEQSGTNIDVGCGTGNAILSYLCLLDQKESYLIAEREENIPIRF